MNNFAEACKLSYLDWITELPNIEEIPEPEYSQKHIKRIKKLFDQMRGDTYHHLSSKMVKILIVAAILVALMLTAFVIPSSREYIIENFDIFGVYQITEHNNNSVNGGIEVGYIPEGYELENIECYSKYINYIYKSENGQNFLISKNSSSVAIDFDTESAKSETLICDGVKYTYYTNSNGFGGIIWINNDYIYQIEGNFSKEELLKIAQTLN